jgi:hypothetical protein
VSSLPHPTGQFLRCRAQPRLRRSPGQELARSVRRSASQGARRDRANRLVCRPRTKRPAVTTAERCSATFRFRRRGHSSSHPGMRTPRRHGVTENDGEQQEGSTVSQHSEEDRRDACLPAGRERDARRGSQARLATPLVVLRAVLCASVSPRWTLPARAAVQDASAILAAMPRRTSAPTNSAHPETAPP